MKIPVIRHLILTVFIEGTAFGYASGPAPEQYRNYTKLLDGVTAQMRDYLASHPEGNIDSVRHNLLETLAEGPVASPRWLPARHKKKLTPNELYDLCRRSSLVFGKMDYVSQVDRDSAYSTASAVALTADGICATNYHVISDVVIGGALDHLVKGDKMRFVMDCDGRAYPVTAVLSVDPVNDLAIFKVDPCGHPLTPAPIGIDASPGDAVFCLANPTGAYFHFTDGMVSNCTANLDKRTGQTRYILEITADYGVGASGGPVFDEYGNLAGIVSSTLSLYANPQQYRNFQMSFKQTVPAFLIRDLFAD